MKKKQILVLVGFSIAFMQATSFAQTENPTKKSEVKTEKAQPTGELKTKSTQQTKQDPPVPQVAINREKIRTIKPNITLSNN